ncbi:flagellar biosynthesis protein FlhA [Rhodovulum bhavnagarense]|uniref:Flagellar biosynthesis protein FlhA n=1 Tax=Rhodovulum bhavnagarense TaxID=992286 RepID=A0A4R2RCQ6_9RHOB|nr:flagellar biosynthesis protein FlhA [Rhodovulum bhavnagarense]TCP61182.1 flagellar biosynthesis protein FlhA [Rhodovulum bhavnagarense]
MLNLQWSLLFRPTILLALALMAVIVMMILPMPAWVLDVGLAISFALAILVFTVTLFVERPLDFSAFPTVLLAALMLRLSLNVSSTKLIIGQGHTGTGAAGEVIEGFAMFVMGGSVFLGLVVFGVLMIVNFMVITKGAGRMAEVGARFALDGMPGKQLAIDSDMAAGAIDHAEARARREREQAETTFFGSLDGASKFVKGDAVAGLLITLLNLVMGLGMGVFVHGMPLGRALETYAILTVGDGLVSQIPAVIISIAAALLLSRGGTKGTADAAVFSQLGRHPAALGTVGILMALFALVPGLPFGPFMGGAALLAGGAYLLHRKAAAVAAGACVPAPSPAPERPVRLGDLLDLDDIHLEFAPDLVRMVLDPGTGIEARIGAMRRHVAERFGLVLPDIRLTDSPALSPGRYIIKIQGVEAARDRLHPDRVLVLMGEDDPGLPHGDDVREPVYAAPARWVDATQREALMLVGRTVVEPSEVLATHLLEVITGNLARLMSSKALRRLLDEVTELSDPDRAAANRRMIEEYIPEKVPPELLLTVLRLLLAERVSIRNLGLILEAVAEARAPNVTPEEICEHVRQRLGMQLVAEHRRDDNTLPLLQLAPDWEERFAEHQVGSDAGCPDIALPPESFNRLAGAVADRQARAAEAGLSPVLAVPARRRRFLRTVLSAKGIAIPVLSFEEIGTHARPALVGTVPP